MKNQRVKELRAQSDKALKELWEIFHSCEHVFSKEVDYQKTGGVKARICEICDYADVIERMVL
jgi:hypothetical protein